MLFAWCRSSLNSAPSWTTLFTVPMQGRSWCRWQPNGELGRISVPQLEKVILRAGCQPWPRPFQNLRASFECDVVEKYPAHVVAKRLGHSSNIAAAHSLTTREHHFDDAAKVSLGKGRQGGAYSGAPEAQTAAPHAIARHRTPSPAGTRNAMSPAENACARGDHPRLRSWHRREVGKEGLELSPLSPENTAISDPGGANSGERPANLKHLVDNWDSLTEDDRRRIRAIVDGRLA